MFYFMVTTSFKYIVKSDKVALNVGIRVGNTVAHPCLCSQIDYYSNVVVSKNALYRLFIGNGSVNEGPRFIQCLNFFQALVFNVDIIIIGNRVNTNYLNIFYIMKQTFDEVATYETSSPRNEHDFSFKTDVVL